MSRFKQYLNEDEPEKRIYFAHPQKYYNTKIETEARKMIVKKWPGHNIINPSGSKWDRRAKKLGFKPFYQAVELADFTVVLPLEDNLLSGGAYKEVKKAEELGKEVWVVKPWENKIERSSTRELKGISKDDPYYQTYQWDED